MKQSFRELLRSPIFLVVAALKFLALFFFYTQFPTQYFIPFFDQAVTHLGENPWSLSPVHFFPYGGFLYLFLFVPKLLFYLLAGNGAIGATGLSLFALKLPLFFADLFLLVILRKLAGNRRKQLDILYWCNPVAFYIIYIHGQLDVVSTLLVLMILYFLVQERIKLSSVVFAFAVLSKFHVMAVAPFLLAYIWSRRFPKQSIPQILTWTGLAGVLIILGFLPIFLSHSIGEATLGGPEVLRLFQAQLSMGKDLSIYLGIVLTLLILGRLTVSTFISDEGLIYGCGLIFTSLILTSNSAPGWFFWALPFLSLFYASYVNAPKLLYALLLLSYLCLFPVQEFYPEILQNAFLMSLLQTFFFTVLLGNLATVWKIAVRKECEIHRRTNPLRIGVAGDSGSGKSNLTTLIQDIFGRGTCTTLEGDNYHRWERGDESWKQFTHLNPKANDLFAMYEHVQQISSGKPVFFPSYDHGLGKFTLPQEIKPTRTLIVQGLHTFFLKGTRNLFDLKIFLAPAEDLRMAWKIKRDCLERGYDLNKVVDQLKAREKDSIAYISRQKKYADLILSFAPLGDFSKDQAIAGQVPELAVTYTLWNDLDLYPFFQLLQKENIQSELLLDETDGDRISLKVSGEIQLPKIERIAAYLFGNKRYVTRAYVAPKWNTGFEGITQILIYLVLAERFRLRQGGGN